MDPCSIIQSRIIPLGYEKDLFLVGFIPKLFPDAFQTGEKFTLVENVL